MKNLILALWMSLFVLAGAMNASAASLAEWNLQGQPGDEATVLATYSATNGLGLWLVRGAGLTGVAATNCMDASGWNNDALDYILFGLIVSPGYKINISGLNIGTRSSPTGPGTMGLYVSTDNYASPLATFDQTGGIYVNSSVTFSTLNDLTDTVYFKLMQIGTNAANGGTTGAGGTFRVTNYFLDNTDTGSFNITGSVAPIPIPGTLGLLGTGLLGLGLFGWGRKRG